MHCCCDNNTNTVDASEPSIAPDPIDSRIKRWPARIVPWIRWAIPITALALIPKCPACLAAYVLLFTGMGLSFSAAATICWGLMAVSVAALFFLVLRTARQARDYRRLRRAVEAR